MKIDLIKEQLEKFNKPLTETKEEIVLIVNPADLEKLKQLEEVKKTTEGCIMFGLIEIFPSISIEQGTIRKFNRKDFIYYEGFKMYKV